MAILIYMLFTLRPASRRRARLGVRINDHIHETATRPSLLSTGRISSQSSLPRCAAVGRVHLVFVVSPFAACICLLCRHAEASSAACFRHHVEPPPAACMWSPPSIRLPDFNTVTWQTGVARHNQEISCMHASDWQVSEEQENWLSTRLGITLCSFQLSLLFACRYQSAISPPNGTMRNKISSSLKKYPH